MSDPTLNRLQGAPPPGTRVLVECEGAGTVTGFEYLGAPFRKFDPRRCNVFVRVDSDGVEVTAGLLQVRAFATEAEALADARESAGE